MASTMSPYTGFHGDVRQTSAATQASAAPERDLTDLTQSSDYNTTEPEQSPSRANQSHSRSTNGTSDGDSSKTAASTSKCRGFQQWATDVWFWEFLLLSLSVTALAAEISVLYSYSGYPLPDWPLGITINTLISILSAISTSALLSVLSSIIGQTKWVWMARDHGRLSQLELIDNASRGPWGSMLFISSARTW